MHTTTHYSGYSNQQTYNTALMYDEIFQDLTITHLRRNRASTVEAAIDHVMDAFETLVMEQETSDLPATGMARDIVEMYLSDVDWWNIADTYVAMHVNLLEQLA
jgi:hypothetical protein